MRRFISLLVLAALASGCTARSANPFSDWRKSHYGLEATPAVNNAAVTFRDKIVEPLLKLIPEGRPASDHNDPIWHARMAFARMLNGATESLEPKPGK